MKFMLQRQKVKTLFVLAPLALMGMLSSQGVYAGGVCRPIGSTKITTINLVQSVNAAGNTAGYTFPGIKTWNNPGPAEMICKCGEGEKLSGVYYWAQYDWDVIRSPGHAPDWYKLNDYIEIRASTDMLEGPGGNRVSYNLPIRVKSNNNPFVCLGNPISYDHKVPLTSIDRGRIDLYITKPFVGTTKINNLFLFWMGASLGPNEPPQTYIARFYLNIDITAPQTCEINANQSLTINFGDLKQNAFKKAGAGNMPADAVPQQKVLSLKCANMDANALLKMRFVGEPDPARPADGFKTTNKDIAIAIEGPNGRLTPVSDDIPITLDANQQNGAVTIKTYPISSTGLAPAAGKYSSTVTVRVDFR